MAIKIGVVGVGVHGLHHVRILSGKENINFAGFFDKNNDISSKVKNEFGIKPFSSLDELISAVDCLIVAVPTSSHYDTVMRCFENGKHVFVEKPIASTVNEAEELVNFAENNGLVFAVGHIERYNSAYRSIREENIQPVFIETHRLSVFNPRGTDVAVVLDLMIHDIDILLSLVRRPVISVNAVGVSVVTDEVDIANARIEFDGGCVANVTASRISQRKMRKVRMFQRNAYVSMDFLTGETEIFKMNPDIKPHAEAGEIPQLMEGISYKKYANDGKNAMALEIEDFLSAITEGRNPMVTGADGLSALKVASQIMESAQNSLRNIRK